MRDRLRAMPLFADLDEQQLERLARGCSEVEAQPGQTLIERGQAGSGMFILEEGSAVVEAPEGERELGPGDAFGERALMGSAVRSARVRARTPVRCVAIARAELERLLDEEPAVAERLERLQSG